MILFDLVGDDEKNPIYQDFAIANGNRQYDFLRSVVGASLAVGRPFLSAEVIKALNFHAIGCLHTSAGEYRPCPVTVGTHVPPPHYRVPALMDDFINMVNRSWEQTDPVALASYVLWRLNWIHPFINGNGRTARAACYFVLCVKANAWLPGTKILPEFIVRERDRYVAVLAEVDKTGQLEPLHKLISELVGEQLSPENGVLAPAEGGGADGAAGGAKGPAAADANVAQAPAEVVGAAVSPNGPANGDPQPPAA